MPVLLVTAFGPFPGAPFNPSAEILADLARRWRPRFASAGVKLVTALLPVAHAIAPHLDALIEREKPDAVLLLGLAGARRQASVETRAANRISPLRPDAAGRFASARGLGPLAFRRSGWDASALAAALRRQGVRAGLSNDAGDYVCNAALWGALAAGKAPAIFIHVPKKRRLAPARMARALAAVLPAAALRLSRRARRGQMDR